MKIIIIGAGTTGITAGYLLEKQGMEFNILEASSTHGGRVRKVEGFVDFPIDVGAEWIHQWIPAKPDVFKSLLNGTDEEFQTFIDKPATFSIWKNGKLRNRNWLRYTPKPIDYKFKEKSWFDAINKMATPDVMKRIQFNTQVSAINYETDTVAVTTISGETHIADKVLVTVPISILQRQVIHFQPSLPSYKIDEINKELMPGGLKIFIKFKKQFYPDMLIIGSIIGAITGLDACAYYNAALGKDSEHHVLGLFTQGLPAERYTKYESDEELLAYVINELDTIFDGKASENYLKHIIQNWTNEPFIQGSYSQRKASAKKLAEPVADQVFFAGEAMNPRGKTIAVHGACESAYLAVDTMLSNQ